MPVKVSFPAVRVEVGAYITVGGEYGEFVRFFDVVNAVAVFGFKLEERVGDGYKWFARFNPVIVDVDVDHERPHWYQFGRKTHSEVEIEGRRPGNTMVELVYARPDEWDRGVDPQKVVQIFVHIE